MLYAKHKKYLIPFQKLISTSETEVEYAEYSLPT